MKESFLYQVFRILGPVPPDPFADITEKSAGPLLVSVRDPVVLPGYGAGFCHGFKCSYANIAVLSAMQTIVCNK